MAFLLFEIKIWGVHQKRSLLDRLSLSKIGKFKWQLKSSFCRSWVKMKLDNYPANVIIKENKNNTAWFAHIQLPSLCTFLMPFSYNQLLICDVNFNFMSWVVLAFPCASHVNWLWFVICTTALWTNELNMRFYSLRNILFSIQMMWSTFRGPWNRFSFMEFVLF